MPLSRADLLGLIQCGLAAIGVFVALVFGLAGNPEFRHWVGLPTGIPAYDAQPDSRSADRRLEDARRLHDKARELREEEQRRSK